MNAAKAKANEQMTGLRGQYNQAAGNLMNRLQGPKIKPPRRSAVDIYSEFSGKNVIMTGATGAIGQRVAYKLLKSGKCWNLDG